MKKAILATKVGMTQIFNEEGILTPVTVLQAGPCVVTQVKTTENDGYEAVQVGFVDKREKLVSKPLKGHFEKAGVSYKRYVREFRFENSADYKPADEIKADIFAAGDKVDATAISKGKGFQGAIKRHGQHRGPMAPLQVPSPSGFQRFRHDSRPLVQGQGYARSDGRRPGDHSESGSGQSGCGEQPDPGEGCSTRTQEIFSDAERNSKSLMLL